MVLRNFQYHLPKTVKEANQLLSKLKEAKVLAGGTFLLPVIKESSEFTADIIGLKNIPELSKIRETENSIFIGSTATLDDIASYSFVKRKLAILPESIEYIATPQIRNMATIGGNVCSGLPWADLPPILLALDAQFQFEEKNISAQEFVNSPFAFTKSSVLKSIKILVDGKIKYAYVRLPRANEEDIPLVSVCILNKNKRFAVSVNFGNQYSRRLTKTEEFLDKDGIAKANLNNALKIFNQEIALVQKDEFRQQMLAVCFKKAVEKYG